MEAQPSRPNDQRYHIFISSTFGDLTEQRKQAIEVVVQNGHIPIALEQFSASNATDLEVITRTIEDSQIYILILGHRYGSLVPDQDISFTELEYNLAVEHGLLILPFVLRPERIAELRSQLNRNNAADMRELENEARLTKFHARIRHFRQLWDPSDQFKFLVQHSLTYNLRECKKRGFVRDDPAISMLTEASENEFIVDIVGQVKNFRKLYDRCLVESERKRAIAQLFIERYLQQILDQNVSLFFESGSTVSYVAKELSEVLAGEIDVDDDGSPNLRISTNNVLAFLELWLKARIPCSTFPWSPPSEETYGASYGGLEKMRDRSPDYRLAPLIPDARRQIDRLMSMPFAPKLAPGMPSLLLGAASGLQVSDQYTLNFAGDLKERAKEELTAQLKLCRGPHVGSYKNKVFKRFMYNTGIPIIIFITSDKIDCPIDVGRCHFMMDSQLTWEDFCRTHPLAFGVGCDQDQLDDLTARFEGLGFQVERGPDSNPVTGLFARNERFIRQFEEYAPEKPAAASPT